MRVDGSSLGFCCVTYPRWSVNCSTRKRKYYELWRRWGSLYSFLLKKDYKTAILFKMFPPRALMTSDLPTMATGF